jgi:hypothetical protein
MLQLQHDATFGASNLIWKLKSHWQNKNQTMPFLLTSTLIAATPTPTAATSTAEGHGSPVLEVLEADCRAAMFAQLP